jgi:hypothetical protein
VTVDPGATVQFGGTCEVVGLQRRIVVGTKFEVVPAAVKGVVSFVNTFFVCGVFNGPTVVSGKAVGLGEL